MQSSRQSNGWLVPSPSRSNWRLIFLLACLVFTAYSPAFNNGFISDDYVILRRIEELKQNPFSLFLIPPESFRLTSYLSFLLLKTCFGYHSAAFYTFTVLLHFMNVLMLWRLLQLVTGNESIAAYGSILFATIQNPQEGVFWLAGMNEALLGAFVLSALLLWENGRFALGSLALLAALFSKESALILSALVPLRSFQRSRQIRFRKEYAYLLIPVLAMAVVYLYSTSRNALLASHLYAFGPHAFPVLLNSLHRLLFPWGYFMLALVAAVRGPRELRVAGPPFAWIILTLIPYLFLTYQNHVPSRNQYVACMGIAWLLASLFERINGLARRRLLVAAFAISNIAYIWFVKDAQYVRRAAITERLAEELRGRVPGRLRVMNFPENPWIAKETTLTIPGWSSDLLSVNEPAEACPNCPAIAWDIRSGRYNAVPPRP